MTCFTAAPAKPAFPFFTLFASFFQNSFTYNDWYQKSSKWEPPSHPKSQKTAKTQHQNAPTVKTCKKTPPGRGQPSEMHGRYTLFSDFSEAQGSQQHTQKGAKMEPPGTQNHKNPINEKQSKCNTATNVLVAAFSPKKQVDFCAGRAFKITIIQEILKMGLRASPEPPTSLKIMILTSKALENYQTTLKNQVSKRPQITKKTVFQELLNKMQ